MHSFEVGHVPRTALWEYLSASRLSLDFKKPADWADQAGYPLGFASALLLFCVVDAIGSHHRGSGTSFTVDGRARKITKTDHHFYVLNSPALYAQSLPGPDLRALYEHYRSALVHNAAMAADRRIYVDPSDPRCFVRIGNVLAVNLPAFHNQSIVAVQNFLDSGMADSSISSANLRRKR